METEYRVLSDIEKRDAHWCVDYDVLVGPNSFECGLTEPEDRIWYRDLSPVITRLNEQHLEIKRLKEKIFLIEEWEGKNYKDLK